MKVLSSPRRTHRRRDNDDGAMLIIALIVITSVAMVTGAVLSHGSANLRSTIVLRGVASTSYAADAGAKLAINNLRLGSIGPDWTTPGFGGSWNDSTWGGWVYTNNPDGTGCFGADNLTPRDARVLNNVLPAAGDQTGNTSVRVECAPVAGTGILGGGSGVVLNSTDPFAQALSTTSSSSPACANSVITGCSGVYLKILGGGGANTVNIGGGVDSAGGVTVENGTVTTEGYLHANQACTGTILSDDVKCSAGSAMAPASVAAVLTAPPSTVYTATTPYPTNCEFVPATYASGKALSTTVNSCTVAHFASGQYYFDFKDTNSSDRVWDITTKVIGGEKLNNVVPGSCKSPISQDNGGNGVQFVFGGESRITFTKNAQLELCGPSGSGAPITISQQLTDGPSVTKTEPQPPVTTTTTTSFGPEAAGTVGTTATGTGFDAFVTNGPVPTTTPATANTRAGALQNSGDSFGAKWTATKAQNGGTLDLSLFADSIPTGASVTSATLHIASSGTPSSDIKMDVTVNGTTVGNNVVPTPSVDITSNQLKTALQASGGSSPTVQIAIATGGGKPALNSNVTLDQVTLTVTYTKQTTTTPPPIVTTVPLEPWSSSSNFIDSTGGATAQPAKFVVQGSTYAPNGIVHIEDSNTDLVAFRWGLVAKGVDFKTYPQNLFGYPLVSIPALGPGLGNTTTAVDLKVFVCVNSSDCTSGGTEALRSRVLITDPPYTDHPVAGKRRMRVLSWSEQR